MVHDVNVSAYSLALKIQVSGATADLLHTLRGYVLTCRGTLNVKVTSTTVTPPPPQLVVVVVVVHQTEKVKRD